jgi:SAM-dependent methyltransferase
MTTPQQPAWAPSQKSGIRLNLGSGPRATPGWVCIDRSPNIWLSRSPQLKAILRRVGVLNDAHMLGWDKDIQRGDIRRLDYKAGTVDAIYSSHTLEHLYLDEAQQVLNEAARVLKQGGLVRLALPDASEMARRFIEGVDEGDPKAGWVFNENLLAHPRSVDRGIKALAKRQGGHTHRWQPTPAMAEGMLITAGFGDVERCVFQRGALSDLELIETRPESFFLEARKR